MAIESEARTVCEHEDMHVQAWIYLSDKLRLTYLSWKNMPISHTCPERHICLEQCKLRSYLIDSIAVFAERSFDISGKQSVKTEHFKTGAAHFPI